MNDKRRYTLPVKSKGFKVELALKYASKAYEQGLRLSYKNSTLTLRDILNIPHKPQIYIPAKYLVVSNIQAQNDDYNQIELSGVLNSDPIFLYNLDNNESEAFKNHNSNQPKTHQKSIENI